MDSIPTTSTSAKDRNKYETKIQTIPNVALPEKSTPSLVARFRPKSRRNVVDETVIVNPRAARRAWKPLRLRFLVANPSGPINFF